MSETQVLGPVAGSERIDALDVLRGFALLGIFLMNMEFFSKPMQAISDPGIDPTMLGLDYWADAFVFFFVQSKFWTLFSLLFGMGFAVMIDRAAAAGRPFVPAYLRRTTGLLLIGLVHAILIWAGDILITYAIGAFTLLVLRGLRHGFYALVGRAPTPMKARTLAWIGSILYAFPLVMLLAIGAMTSLTGHKPSPEDAAKRVVMLAEHEKMREQATYAYSSGSYAEATTQRAADTAKQVGETGGFMFFLLGVFLTGAAIIRSGVLSRSAEHLPALRRFRNLMLPIGFAMMALSTWLGTGFPMDNMAFPQATQLAGYLGAGLVLALAYGATLVVALHGAFGPWLQRWLAPAGRMALTNYLTQSVVCTLIFYHYGLGLWGQVGRAGQVLLVFGIYGAQLLLSRWWLARFNYGPMEWLWRSITYWRLPAMRKTPA
ncbi:DUF418 domain-containing protein [Arenimonas sp.]|uniref:DUF418 domain-containing protein n=1 Tax=Arenimonas sp. TaxID=1872635 RepID=UPI0039E24776